MRNGRRLRRELDIWKVAWQEVETLVDRLEQLRDEDDAPERRMLALLRVARVVEHEQVRRHGSATGSGEDYLGDPLVDELPRRGLTPLAADEAWELDLRAVRLPGTDDAELAVANIELAVANPSESDTNLDPPEVVTSLSDMPEAVRVIPAREVFELRVDQDDERHALSEDGLFMLELPSYPIAADGTVLAAPSEPVDISEADVTGLPTASLFCRTRRYRATMRDHIAMQLGKEAEEVAFSAPLSWTGLAANRRAQAGVLGADYVGSLGEEPWTGALESALQGLVDTLRAGSSTAGYRVDGLLPHDFISLVEAKAADAFAALERDSADLVQAEATMVEVGDDVLEGDELRSVDEIISELSSTRAWLTGQRSAFEAMESAAASAGEIISTGSEYLPFGGAGQSQREAAADLLEAALDGVIDARSGRPELLSQLPEDGALGPFLDEAFATRVAYPDGTLRLRRTLEWAFRLSWPPRLRWMKQRLRIALRPLMARVRRPFVDGLRALLDGGETGLSVAGLELFEEDPLVLGEDAPVGATALITTHPSSIIPSLPIDVGEVAILEAERSSVAVITGVTASADRRLQLVSQPLRVSLQSGAEVPGSAGLVSAGTLLGHRLDRGLDEAELRTGEHQDGPHMDGLVEGTLALWSQLSLVFGWELVEDELRGTSGVAWASSKVVAPSTRGLHELELHGSLSTTTRSVALQAVGDDWWDRSADPPEQAVARKGELLLVRGEDADGHVWQGVVEVEAAYRTTGAMVSRMEGSGIQRLSTDADDIVIETEEGAPTHRCTPCGREAEVVVLVFSQVWLDRELVSDITFRRDFEGFDLPSLATGVLLPPRVILQLTGECVRTSPRRDAEFRCASRLLEDWTRYAR